MAFDAGKRTSMVKSNHRADHYMSFVKYKMRCMNFFCECAQYESVYQHLPPIASISSKNMIQAFFVLAISNNSLTIRAPCKIHKYISYNHHEIK